MTDHDLMRLDQLRQCLVKISIQRPRDWCAENLYFDEPNNRGPFRLAGQEYIGDVLDDFANPLVADEVLVWGSQTKKTGTLMGGAAWAAVNDPCRFLWVMPSLTLAQSFSSTRLQPMFRASESIRKMIPTKAARHEFKRLEMRLGPSILNFTGSNSAANLASIPCRRVILDEVDKFDTQGGNQEADAVNLAEQRTKGQANPQRWKTSSPTLVEALIWQEFLKGNQCRYDVPCPACSKKVLLAWSAQYTILAKTGREAYVVWDKEARRADGSWDLDRVHRSARFQCPHCAGDILDSKKTWMVRDGVWTPTNLNASTGFVSRQLSSLYACSPETSCGNLALKFLNQKRSLLGLQGFINGDLAEPFQSQDTQGERIEIIRESVEVTAEYVPLLTVDCQARAPYFWHVVRQWNKADSVAVSAGPLDTWDDVEAIQRNYKVQDRCVMPDSGHGAKSDADVYRVCAEHGKLVRRQDKLPQHVGWIPAKGQPGRRRWRNAKGLMLPWRLQPIDPFDGTTRGGRLEMSLFEFASDFFNDILDSLRRGEGGRKWEVLKSVATEEYWRHLDGQIKAPVRNARTGYIVWTWIGRGKHWPDHMRDCEIMQVALANFFALLSF